ncbi:MAG: ketoacyl-ACP synthase III [Nitrospirae bacterium]|nr:ketoacyl-ACP synthase III [Nitrospirota bacterium]MBI3595432.1 ketoacyl-ACP synthase III [Nitrospirota bacterium]
MNQKYSQIVGTGSYLPQKVMTNADLERIIDTSDEWIRERTGIRERRIADDKEAASDLAVEAAKKALQAAGIGPEEIDLILVATLSPDMAFPSTACMVQSVIGARKAFAFDLSAACSGFIYALSVADQYLKSGRYRYALVIGSEVISRVLDWKDRSTCIIFGDGAGAVVLKAIDSKRGILSTHLHSDGQYWDLLYVPGGGSRLPFTETVLAERQNFLKMKGSETFKIAVRNLEEVAWEALNDLHLSIENIALMIPHQANIRIIRALADRLKLPEERVVVNIDRIGNTSAASIPIALDEAVRSNRIQEGDFLLLIAFGAGLTWGASVIKW